MTRRGSPCGRPIRQFIATVRFIITRSPWYRVCAPRRGRLGLFSEYFRTHLFSGFPWALLGDTQVHRLPLIQIASITGVYGVSFLLVWGNLALSDAISGSRRALAIIGFGWPSLCGGPGYAWMQALQSSSFSMIQGHEIKIALLQGNIDQYKKWNEVFVKEIKQTYQTLVEARGKEARSV